MRHGCQIVSDMAHLKIHDGNKTSNNTRKQIGAKYRFTGGQRPDFHLEMLNSHLVIRVSSVLRSHMDTLKCIYGAFVCVSHRFSRFGATERG